MEVEAAPNMRLRIVHLSFGGHGLVVDRIGREADTTDLLDRIVTNDRVTKGEHGAAWLLYFRDEIDIEQVEL